MNDIMVDLGAITARAEAATDGPWEYSVGGNDDYEPGLYAEVLTVSHGDTVVQFDLGTRSLNEQESAKSWATDAEFIAHAREDIPALLALVKNLNEQIVAAKAALGREPSCNTESNVTAALDALTREAPL
jgi:hypothetical protein